MSGQIEVMTANERNHLNAVAQEVCERMDELERSHASTKVHMSDLKRTNKLEMYKKDLAKWCGAEATEVPILPDVGSLLMLLLDVTFVAFAAKFSIAD